MKKIEGHLVGRVVEDGSEIEYQGFFENFDDGVKAILENGDSNYYINVGKSVLNEMWPHETIDMTIYWPIQDVKYESKYGDAIID